MFTYKMEPHILTKLLKGWLLHDHNMISQVIDMISSSVSSKSHKIIFQNIFSRTGGS